VNRDADFYPYTGEPCKSGYQLGSGNCRKTDGRMVAVPEHYRRKIKKKAIRQTFHMCGSIPRFLNTRFRLCAHPFMLFGGLSKIEPK
jgi:hypothetical protein